MAVYTTVSTEQVNALLTYYALPTVKQIRAATDGIENTTYFLTLANENQYVLTLYESLNQQQLEPYISLTSHLHNKQLPVPTPLADKQGCKIHELNGKPAVLVPMSTGKHIHAPSPQQCRAVGEVLSACHMACEDFTPPITNRYDINWFEQTINALCSDSSSLTTDDQALLLAQLELAQRIQQQSLPRGIIHGDLFRDNVLMADDCVSALIDFNDAGYDCLLFDLAITYNDWCFDRDGEFLARCAEELLAGYQQRRPLTELETNLWGLCLQVAATRFWISRLLAAELAASRGQSAPKDPNYYRKLLLWHQKNPINENNSQ